MPLPLLGLSQQIYLINKTYELGAFPETFAEQSGASLRGKWFANVRGRHRIWPPPSKFIMKYSSEPVYRRTGVVQIIRQSCSGIVSVT
ncbi:hypothetical protein [Paracoccus sp. Ld10]|uniref:hypothetical protein n=1 Tax=Paracoccus sp. Ld10 TaxID=649158 RepID=UPI00386C4322